MRNVYYKTNFNLECPVLDIQEANDYLQEDDMTKYLLDSLRDDKVALEEIEKVEYIYWTMTSNDTGNIILTANDKLLPATLDKISEWVSGQCSDGLGEGFEQQPFASYENLDGGYYDEEDNWVEDNGYCMASFDWKTNKYKFVQVVSPTQKLQENKGLRILKSNEFIRESFGKQETVSENTYAKDKINLDAIPYILFKMEPTKLSDNCAGLKLFCSCGCDINDLNVYCKLNFECFYSITIKNNIYEIDVKEEKVYDANDKNNNLTSNMFTCAQLPFVRKKHVSDVIYDEFSKDTTNIFTNNLFVNLLTGKLKDDGLASSINEVDANTLRDECFEKFSNFIEKTIEDNLNK